jgi:hypothetical protein
VGSEHSGADNLPLPFCHEHTPQGRDTLPMPCRFHCGYPFGNALFPKRPAKLVSERLLVQGQNGEYII